MYNRYVPRNHTYTPVAEPDRNTEERPKPPDEKKYIRADDFAQAPRRNSGQNIFCGGSGGLNLGKMTDLLNRDKLGSLGSLFASLGLDGVDTGDLLLILIVLLLVVEGDDLELIITLGLMLVLGLGDKAKKAPDDKKSSGASDLC